MIVLGVDPGLRACGVALGDGPHWWVSTIRPRAHGLLEKIDEVLAGLPLARPELVVIELPQVYQGHLQKGDPNDLIALAVLVGALVARYAGTRTILPRPAQWKGQVPKDIHHRRIRARVPELGRCSKDALDAVGLALYGLEQSNAGPAKR